MMNVQFMATMQCTTCFPWKEKSNFITIKALVDPVSLEFPSVTPKVKAAVWGERELFDMYGLKAVGLPDQRRLVLPDDWPDDLYPLRKDSMDYRLRPDPTNPR